MINTQQPQYSDSRLHREVVYVPEHPVRRWLLPLVAGLVAFVAGVGIGSAGQETPRAECAEMADEYAVLVSEGIDAGLSMDETWMAEVAAKRDSLQSAMHNTCG